MVLSPYVCHSSLSVFLPHSKPNNIIIVGNSDKFFSYILQRILDTIIPSNYNVAKH